MFLEIFAANPCVRWHTDWSAYTLGSVVAPVLLLSTPAATAQEQLAELEHGIRLEYQFNQTGEIDSSIGDLDIGETTTHALVLSVDYSLGERWTVFGSIPYVQRRHKGAGVHDATVDFVAYTPPDLRVVDDGHFHGGLQDVSIGTRYLATDGPLKVSPFIAVGSPVSNYPIYGNAVIGKHLWEVPVGVSLEFTPYFSDWFFQADISYVFSEEVLGVNLDYWLWHASASYYVTRRFAPRVFLTQRDAPDALQWPDDYTDDLDNEAWYQHDRMITHGYLNAGIGFDYIVNDRYAVSATYYNTIEQDQVAKIEDAFTFAVTVRF